jgi:protein Mpv17
VGARRRLLVGCVDLVAQDWARTGRMAVWTAALTPGVHLWYNWLMRRFPHSPLRRMVADQLIWAPVGLAGFFVAMGWMETGNPGTGVAKLQRSFLPVMGTNWLVRAGGGGG